MTRVCVCVCVFTFSNTYFQVALDLRTEAKDQVKLIDDSVSMAGSEQQEWYHDTLL